MQLGNIRIKMPLKCQWLSTFNWTFIFHSNIAEALVGKGLAKVVRYRQDDDCRSAYYDDLLQAEDRATKKQVGLHSKKEAPVIRVADVSGVSKEKGLCKTFLLNALRYRICSIKYPVALESVKWLAFYRKANILVTLPLGHPFCQTILSLLERCPLGCKSTIII